MQSFEVIKSPNQKSEDPIDTPHTSTAGTPSQHFFIDLFQYAAGDGNKKMALALSFLLILAQRAPLSTEIH